jgi:hypothetical protein
MDFLGIGALAVIVVVGSLVFWVCLQNSIIINPSLQGFFSWWLGCVVGTAVVLYILVDLFFGAVSWAIDFGKQYYMYILGVVVVLGGICMLGHKKTPASEFETKQDEKME